MIRELLLDNPMKIESSRYLKKVFGLKYNAPTIIIAKIAALFFIVASLYSLLTYDLSGGIGYVMAALFGSITCILSFALTYGSVAGERERRTWEILLTAPVTKAQIIVGKYYGALVTISTVWLIGTGLALLANYQFEINKRYFSAGETHPYSHIFLYSLGYLTFALFVGSVTMFFSARTSKAMTAFFCSLLCTIGLMAVSGLLGGTDIFVFGPFAPNMIDKGNFGSYTANLMMQLFLAGAFIYWAIYTLHFADNQVAFTKKKKSFDA